METKPKVTGQQELVVQDRPGAMQITPAAATPADIVLYAMKNGGSIAEIREFMQLQREWEADQARKAFVADMAEFKKNPPEVVKDKQVGYKSKDGFVGYSHATLGNVTEAIVAGLARHGLSHRWIVDQTGGQVTVSCVLTHKLGHTETTVMSGLPDDSGKKNGIQQVASTVTYLSRYTLLAATGIATKEQDDDGAKAELDTTLADKWIKQAKDAAGKDALADVWARGVDEINKAGDRHAYDEFKAVVNARKKELTA